MLSPTFRQLRGQEPFFHKTLESGTESIRLLEIQPREEHDDRIECTLLDFGLSEYPNYTALSYAWGEDEEKRRVWVDGRHFDIRLNLWRFLFNARQPLPTKTRIWFHAICIDQTSIEERNCQVSIMGQIYKQAVNVICWLGECGRLISSFFGIVAAGEMAYDESRLKYVLPEGWYEQNLFGSTSAVQDEHESLRLYLTEKAVRLLLLNPYWRRTWITQEILLAKRLQLMSGTSLVAWESLFQVLQTWQLRAAIHLTTYNPFRYQSLRTIRSANDPRNPVWHMDALLEQLHCTQCQDDRDRVFSVRALVKDGDTFTVDYTLPVTVLALRAAAHFGGGMRLLTQLTRCLNISPQQLDAFARSCAGTTMTEDAKGNCVPAMVSFEARPWFVTKSTEFADGPAIDDAPDVCFWSFQQSNVRSDLGRGYLVTLVKDLSSEKIKPRTFWVNRYDESGNSSLRYFSRCRSFLAINLPDDKSNMARITMSIDAFVYIIFNVPGLEHSTTKENSPAAKMISFLRRKYQPTVQRPCNRRDALHIGDLSFREDPDIDGASSWKFSIVNEWSSQAL